MIINRKRNGSEDKDNYILKWHPNAVLPPFILFWGFGISFVLLAISLADRGIVLFILLYIFFAATLLLFFTVFFRGKKRAIFFDNEKAWQTIKGIKYEWHWTEMTDIKLRSSRFWEVPGRFPLPVVEIITKPDYKSLIFVIDLRREKLFLKLCPNEVISQAIKQYGKPVMGR